MNKHSWKQEKTCTIGGLSEVVSEPQMADLVCFKSLIKTTLVLQKSWEFCMNILILSNIPDCLQGMWMF